MPKSSDVLGFDTGVRHGPSKSLNVFGFDKSSDLIPSTIFFRGVIDSVSSRSTPKYLNCDACSREMQ